VISAACSGSTPIDTGGAGLDGGTLLGTPLPGGLTRSEHTRRARQGHLAEPPQRAKPHDLQNLVSSGWLERLHFDYKPATPATMFRHPSSLGLRP